MFPVTEAGLVTGDGPQRQTGRETTGDLGAT
jgi:hypothetical protein